MQCPECDTEVREFEWHCTACNHDCGYPNVRAAQKPEEQAELARRVQVAEAEVSVKGTTNVLNQFRQAMHDSKAVLCRSLSKTQELVSSDNEIYSTFYQLVGAGNRRPEETQIERDRLLADDLLFPHYRQHIRFAALSLDCQGVGHYGGCSIVFKETAIRKRATVFEENSLSFCAKRKLGVGRPVPPGYRALWEERDRLAIAKLGTSLELGSNSDDFPKVLQKKSEKPEQQNFIEVHIYGPLHRRSIERVVTQKPTPRADRIILRNLKRVLSDIGATLE